MIWPLITGFGSALWRYVDGSGHRPKGSNILGFLCVLLAALLSYLPTYGLSHDHIVPYIAPVLISCYLMVRGMPGWEYWLPNRNSQGTLRQGMLIGFALPTLLGAILYNLLTTWQLDTIWFALSGLGVAATYVVLSDLEKRGYVLPWNLTAEEIGRFSYGCIPASITLL